MNNPRPIDKVVEAILNIIPNETPNKSELKETLDKIVQDSFYKAPEIQYESWGEVTWVLEKETKDYKPELLEKLIGVFNGKVDYKEYL